MSEPRRIELTLLGQTLTIRSEATPDYLRRLAKYLEERVAQLIRTLGLYRTKARNIIALSRLLVERYGGEVPRDRQALETLPGVGRKTANIVLNVAFGEPAIAVDTHIFRVANRTGLAPGKTPLAVETALEAVTPERLSCATRSSRYFASRRR